MPKCVRSINAACYFASFGHLRGLGMFDYFYDWRKFLVGWIFLRYFVRLDVVILRMNKLQTRWEAYSSLPAFNYGTHSSSRSGR